MTRVVGVFTAFVMLIYGLSVINEWYYEHKIQNKEVEAETLEELGMDGLLEGKYVSFYIENYADKAIYVEGDIEYEIYTILAERDESNHTYSYIQVMVKEEDTKQKLNHLKEEKVYFQGEVIEIGYGDYLYDEAWVTNLLDVMKTDRDVLICDYVIKETEIPDEGYYWIVGLMLIILSVVLYYISGGIKAIVPSVEIKSDKFIEYDNVYCMNVHNISNELLCEKDNLKILKSKQIENKKVDNIMTVMFCIGLLLLCCGNVMEFLRSIVLLNVAIRSVLMVILVVLKIIGVILVLISVGGVWSRFINSSHKLAVYIAVKRRKKSIYVEIERCKKNIEYLERIIEEENIQEINNVFEKP